MRTGSAHHPTLGLEGSVRSDDLRSVLSIYKYSVLGIWSEQVDGDNPKSVLVYTVEWFESHGIRIQTRLEFKDELSTP